MAQSNFPSDIHEAATNESFEVLPRVTGDLEAAPAVEASEERPRRISAREVYKIRAEHGFDFLNRETAGEFEHPQTQNPAYGRGPAFSTDVDVAEAILGADCARDVSLDLGSMSPAAREALARVPYSIDELKAAKGRYVLVAVPEMNGTEALLAAMELGLKLNFRLMFGSDRLDQLVIPAGWYLIKKTDAPKDTAGSCEMPRVVGAFVLLYAAALTKATGQLCGSSSETTWRTEQMNGIGEDEFCYCASTLINRSGSAYVQMVFTKSGRVVW